MIDFLRRILGRHPPETEDMRIQEAHELHDLSQQVFWRRQQAGLTQAALAGQAGMTQAQIAELEAANANPTNRTLTKLAHALGCRIRDLYAEDQPTPAFAGDIEGLLQEIQSRRAEVPLSRSGADTIEYTFTEEETIGGLKLRVVGSPRFIGEKGEQW